MPFTKTPKTTFTVEQVGDGFTSGARFVFFPFADDSVFQMNSSLATFTEFITKTAPNIAGDIDGVRRFCFITDARSDGFYVCELFDSKAQVETFVWDTEDDASNMKGFTAKFADMKIFSEVKDYRTLPTEEVMDASFAYFKYTIPDKEDQTQFISEKGAILQQKKLIQIQAWNINPDKIEKGKELIGMLAPQFKEIDGVESFVVTIGENTVGKNKGQKQCMTCTVWENKTHFDAFQASGDNAKFEAAWRYLLVNPHDVTPVIDIITENGLVLTNTIGISD